MSKITITIAELEKITGVKRSTIHHYVRSGLLHEPDKTSQTMAYYDKSHIDKIEAIKKIKTDFLKNSKTTRVPLDYIQDKLGPAQGIPENRIIKEERPASVFAGKQKNLKKKQIIKEALVLFTTKGYRKTTLKEISKKVGISMPSLHHYFPDKRELFVEAVDHVIQEWRDDVSQALSETDDPTQKGVIMFECFQKHHPKISEILDYLSSEAGMGDKWAIERMKNVFSKLMENVLASTQAGIEKGIMRDLNPELMAYFFIKINEAATQRLALDDKYTPEQIMAFVADIIAFGLLTPERQASLAAKQIKE